MNKTLENILYKTGLLTMFVIVLIMCSDAIEELKKCIGE